MMDATRLARGRAKWEMVDKLVDIILRHCKGCIVEIGMGLSTYVLAWHAMRTGRVFYSCDICRRAPQLFSDHMIVLNKSVDFIEEFEPRPIAVILIDGLHEAGTVRKEVDFFLPMLEPGGVMFLHDTLPPSDWYLPPHKCGGVYKVRRELEDNPDVNCFTWPYTASGVGLTMVMNKPKELLEV